MTSPPAEFRLRPLTVTPAVIDALGAGHGHQLLPLLRPARRSRNLLLLRALRDRALAAGPGEPAAARLEAGLDLLREVQRHAPAVFAEVLDDPMTGAWAAHCLRSGTGRQGLPQRLPAAAGDAAVLAAAAAHRAGLRFRITVPLRFGGVMLPGLGLARLPGRVAEVRSDGPGGGTSVLGGGTVVRVPRHVPGGRPGAAPGAVSGVLSGQRGHDEPGWHGLPRIRCATRGTADGREDGGWAVALDSLNPYRLGGPPLPPRPLDAAEIDLWSTQLAAAWRILIERHPDRAEELRQTVVAVAPLNGQEAAVDDRGGWLSATFGDAVGLIALAPHGGPRALAAGLVHEAQHSKLCALLDVTDLLRAPADARCYSPWREDPRPPDALLQGAFAFLAVAGFWRDEAALPGPESSAGSADDELSAEARFARWYRPARDVVATLGASPWPTADGQRFLAAMRRTLDSWDGTPVGPDAEIRARTNALEHRVRWRLRHVAAPLPRLTAARLAADWCSGARGTAPAVPLPAVRRAPSAGPGPAPDSWEPPVPRPEQPGAAPEALTLAGLDARLAATDGGDDTGDWAGDWARLAALAFLLADPRGRALAAMPELVRQVHTAVRSAAGGADPARRSPLQLSQWLWPVVRRYAAGRGT